MTAARTARAATGVLPGAVVAPFSGAVAVLVREGEPVVAGQVVATIEAMKMQAPVQARRDGVVRSVALRAPRLVEAGEVLLEIAPGPIG